MVKREITSEGVSLTCDWCGKRVPKGTGFTWLVNGKPANPRFCSSECLFKYDSVEV